MAREILDSRGNPTVEVEVELALGRPGPGRGPERGQHRRPRGRRAARRRRPLRRQGRRSGRSRNVNGEIAETIVGLEALDQRLLDQALIDARRHRQQGPPRRQRPARRVARGRQGRRRRVRPPALPLRRRRERARAAAAVHERAQRRRARRLATSTCRSSCSRPSARRRFSEALRMGAETYHALEDDAARPRACRPRSATRVASRPTSRRTRKR